KVLFACGGSGGHVIPAISMAQILEDSHAASSFVFVGSEGGIEKRITAKEGYAFRHIPTEGLHRSLTLRNFRTLYLAATSTRRAVAILKEEKPSLVIGTGGYVSFPLIRAAKRLSIPCLLYEPNAVPGLAVKLTEKAADAVLLQFEECKTHLRFPEKATVMGAPLRRGFSFPSRAEARRRLHMNQKDFVFLSFGGSLGAERISETILGAVPALKCQGVRLVHACGERLYNRLKFSHPGEVADGTLLPYIDDMPSYMAAADLILCRAGAITLAELSCAARASLLVPSPYVAGNHQFKNAEFYRKSGAALLLSEQDLSVELITERVLFLKQNPSLIDAMEASARKLSRKNAKNIFLKTVARVTEPSQKQV
ncbi:MAG: UDP-N-acetylglucosamine--N-acetylmuramyl-(pentapeptide) pyrophosphoryl-undecaprenol N-acetylglucosamine transferase, partial [Clostridia bacterium]|nr:UDP-N-acetylglucosamine--N-acetylmuramyl-(pentapeptide) pyrophosphoryl-undecaprenol N-acetylglucosamine transferase [Clostridia bacterium]